MNQICLIVDDHDALRDLLRQWLSDSLPLIEFQEATSAEQALELAIKLEPRAILMDISLPTMNGIEATSLIKQALPDATVIIHTIHEELIYREKAAQAGADFYITKKETQIALMPLIKTVFSFQDC